MTHDDTITNTEVERPLDRRLLLRGGAVLAGAAGVTVIGAAMGASTADAADGDSLLLGQQNAATLTTEITLGGALGGDPPTLTLTNYSGPGLRLTPTSGDYEGACNLARSPALLTVWRLVSA